MRFSTLFMQPRAASWCLFILLALGTLAAQAQQVALKGDMIVVDKKPFGKLVKGGSMLMRDYTLQSVDGKDVMKTKGNIVALPSNETFVFYVLTFQPGGETAEMSKTGLNFQQQLAEALVQNEVMRDGQPNPEGIQRFVAAYSEKLSAKYAAESEKQANAKPLEYSTVQRQRGGQVATVFNKRTQRTEIVQGNQVIGYLSPLENDKGRVKWDVRLPDGMSVAEMNIEAWMADAPGARDISYKILVKKNNQFHTRSAVGGVSVALQDGLQYLVSGGYL
ncbi:hypothetical protein [Hymenobacter oligotrophus]|nr:hypothetical protein [Hymenobacter oligotrophus]